MPNVDKGTAEEISDLRSLNVDVDCHHHWKIQAPTGRISLGRCTKCGGLKEFLNSVGMTTWDPRKGRKRKS